eukprot:5346324-Prymnesium_polylepis.1
MAPVSVGSEELAVALPLARVTKIIKLNTEIVKIGRDACFLVRAARHRTLGRAVLPLSACAPCRRRTHAAVLTPPHLCVCARVFCVCVCVRVCVC